MIYREFLKDQKVRKLFLLKKRSHLKMVGGMKVEYSKQFVKAAYKLTGKYKISLNKIISETIRAKDVTDLTNCVKMVGFQNSYRIKMGDYRLIFILKIVDQVVIFELLLSRGEIYRKEHEMNLRNKEK
jgi:mRNA-degrading endonuclease RelE of RelBE toxin-antitoxin system